MTLPNIYTGPPPLHPYWPICGFDLSYYQTNVDWEKASSVGSRFAIVRCGYGSKSDIRYSQHTSNARSHGVPFGAYFYWTPNYVLEDQIKTLRNTVGSWPQMGVYIDLEKNNVDKWPTTLTVQSITNMVLSFLKEADKIWYKPVGIYTSAGWWNSWISQTQTIKFELWRRILWDANWRYSFQKTPLYPYGWPRTQTKWWQFSGTTGPQSRKAKEFGVSGTVSVDVDCFMGTEADYNRIFNVRPV
jgi:GH25 family lysozyme M1 (1,4-beta-N-acetylmuramidase)